MSIHIFLQHGERWKRLQLIAQSRKKVLIDIIHVYYDNSLAYAVLTSRLSKDWFALRIFVILPVFMLFSAHSEHL